MILKSSRVVLPERMGPASIHVQNGRIARIDDARADVDLGDLVISPGVVDTHVHVNEPGRTEWEGFDTATRAAAAGGVTTVVDMPLNSVPATVTTQALAVKRAAAQGKCHVDVAFWGGVVPGNTHELDGLVDEGVRGFKCFLAPSGVDEFPMVGERDLREALPILARRQVPLLVHAEDPAHLLVPPAERPGSRYQVYLGTRPPAAERAAIDLMIRLAREFGAHVHIVHVACAEGVEAIERAKADGLRISAETCPHYLTFAAGEIADGATEFKCAPPIREARHRDALRASLWSGALDLVATDHSPAPPAMKCGGDFLKAWGGIASLEMSLSATWTNTHRPEIPAGAGLTFVPWDGTSEFLAISRWMSAEPAKLAGLAARKGGIAVGCDADFVAWDPDATWTVEPSSLQQRHKLTPYAGRTLRGVVRATYVRGERVWADGRLERSATGMLL